MFFTFSQLAKKFITLVICFQLLLPSSIFAQGEIEKIAEFKDDVIKKVLELFRSEKTKGWEFFNVDGESLTIDDLIDKIPPEFRMLSPKGTEKKRYGFRIKIQFKIEEKETKVLVAIAVQDEGFKKVFTRRALKLTSLKSSAENMLSVEQSMKSLDSELIHLNDNEKQTKIPSFFEELFFSAAYAKSKDKNSFSSTSLIVAIVGLSIAICSLSVAAKSDAKGITVLFFIVGFVMMNIGAISLLEEN